MFYLVHFFPVLIAAVASTIVGAFWYSPLLFGREWARLTALYREPPTHAASDARRGYVASFAADVVTGAILAFFLSSLAVSNVLDVLAVVWWFWLGFTVPIAFGEVVWGGQPRKLFLLNAGCRLATLGAMGVVLSVLV